MPWKTVGSYDVLEQSQLQSCGYCCIAMAVNQSGNGQRTETGMVAEGRRVGGGGHYDRGARNIPGAQKTVIRDMEDGKGQVEHWGSGTYGQHLADVARQAESLNAAYFGGQSSATMKAAMRSVNPAAGRMMIALVQWAGGQGGHWVLVVGRDRHLGKASGYTVLDPSGNVVVNSGSTSYRAANGATGTFAGYYVLITGKIVHQRRQVMGN